jgi:hypothetical protein
MLRSVTSIYAFLIESPPAAIKIKMTCETAFINRKVNKNFDRKDNHNLEDTLLHYRHMFLLVCIH